MVSGYLTSLIRTWVPIGIGLVLTWLAEHFNIVLDSNSQAGLSALAVAVLTAGYYALVRLLEHKWPKIGILLGKAAKPVYQKAA